MSPCEKVELPGGGFAIVKVGKSRGPKCKFCRKASTRLCDVVIGKTLGGAELTCSAPICDDHARPDPRNPNRDTCPKH